MVKMILKHGFGLLNLIKGPWVQITREGTLFGTVRAWVRSPLPKHINCVGYDTTCSLAVTNYAILGDWVAHFVPRPIAFPREAESDGRIDLSTSSAQPQSLQD